MLAFLDTSAAVKLVVAEAESRALRTWISNNAPELVGSDLLRIELIRAVLRTQSALEQCARTVLERVHLRPIGSDLCSRAALLEPVQLRSLDALHLATAIDFGPSLGAFLTYDQRLAGAARDLRLPVVSPS